MTQTSVAMVKGGFHTDERMEAAGFTGGVTTKAMGDMAQAANRAKVLDTAGLGAWPAYLLKQVHGNGVRDLSTFPAAQSESVDNQGDGWIVDAAGRVALAYAADCMPIFIWDRRGEAAAVLHSGWKGTQANIAAAGVAALAARGVAASEMEAYIGPRARACCYSVGNDFEKIFRTESLERRDGRLYLDLGKEASAQLIQAGLSREAISCSPACTVCASDLFSFRRDKQGTRMMAFLAMRHGS